MDRPRPPTAARRAVGLPEASTTAAARWRVCIALRRSRIATVHLEVAIPTNPRSLCDPRSRAVAAWGMFGSARARLKHAMGKPAPTQPSLVRGEPSLICSVQTVLSVPNGPNGGNCAEA